VASGCPTKNRFKALSTESSPWLCPSALNLQRQLVGRTVRLLDRPAGLSKLASFRHVGDLAANACTWLIKAPLKSVDCAAVVQVIARRFLLVGQDLR
jgi:hypothetical protein